ncbi:MAG: hypothetical protein KA271_01690 [Propionivibrio sp.]|nr:hypothetical protein [Propionivibrio sp.]
MKIELIQGSPEWHAHRATHDNASELASVQGLKPGRQELLRAKHTGITADVDEWTQKFLFDRGHEIEAIARTFAEEFIDLDIGQSLQPCVFSEEIDGLKLSASLDGLNGSTMWECKSLNAELKDAMRQDRIPDMYHPQMEQGLMLSGAKKCLFTASDGTREGTYHVYYVSNSKTLARIIPSWKQFHEDLANYQHVEAKPAPVAAAIDALPALLVQVEGRVLATNLDVFKESALKFIAGINTNLQTDQDFADAEKTVKFCKDGEERLELVKAQALAQTASIDDLFRTIDNISAELKTKRLQLDKLVKAEKENRKIEIIQQAKDTFQQHVSALNKRIGGSWMPGLMPAFAEAIKGLKSLDSMREKVGTTLANAKIEANEIADRITDNRNSLDGDPPQYGYWMFLFPDFASVCTKAREDFDALLASRIAKHEASIEAERARIQAEERAKAEREAAAKIEAAKQEAVRQERERAEQEAKAKAEEDQRGKASTEDVKPVAQTGNAADREDEGTQVANASTPPNTTREGEPAMPAWAGLEPAQPVSHIADAGKMVDDGATMKLGDISARLGFTVTADFLASLGFQHIRQDKNAKLYRACDFRWICHAIANHVLAVADERMAE